MAEKTVQTTPKRPRKACVKCKRILAEEDYFWKMKNGERTRYCKTCLTQYIDNTNPESFLWILKEFDVPYIPNLWIDIAQAAYNRKPTAFNNKSVIGRYIRTCNMNPWRDWGYEDSDLAAHDWARTHRRASYIDNEEEQKKLEEKYEKGEISEYQYKSLLAYNCDEDDPDAPVGYIEPFGGVEKLPFKFLEEGEMEKAKQEVKKKSAAKEEPKDEQPSQAEEEKNAIKEALKEKIPVAPKTAEMDIVEELSKGDLQYLLTKWGDNFKPTEWVRMEDMYNRYYEEYDMNVDREETLKMMCKTSIMADNALEASDVQSYRTFSQVLNDLRKSGKFTEAQNKTEEKRDIDSIGELVATVEECGGIIENFDVELNPNPDKIDFTIANIKNYINNLVKNDMGLGNIIENYVKKLEQNKKDENDAELDSVIESVNKQLDEETKNDIAADQYTENLEDNVEEEINELSRLIEEKGDD